MSLIKQVLSLSFIFFSLSCSIGVKSSNTNEDRSWLQSDNEILSIQVYYLGHSLISDVNDMAMSILNYIEEDSFTFDEQEIPGCPLSWHWDETQAGGLDPFISDREIHMRQLHEALDSGDYSHIVITDSVPRGGSGITGTAEPLKESTIRKNR